MIAPDPSFDYVHVAHQEFAMLAAREFNRIRLEQILYELSQGRRILEAEERLSRRKEFSQWKQALSATAADIRKWAKLVLTFGSFPVEKITKTWWTSRSLSASMDVNSFLSGTLVLGENGGCSSRQMEENCRFLVETNSV